MESVSIKRLRNIAFSDFNKDIAYAKILDFFINNNITFNVIESDSFKELLNYYNRYS